MTRQLTIALLLGALVLVGVVLGVRGLIEREEAATVTPIELSSTAVRQAEADEQRRAEAARKAEERRRAEQRAAERRRAERRAAEQRRAERQRRQQTSTQSAPPVSGFAPAPQRAEDSQSRFDDDDDDDDREDRGGGDDDGGDDDDD